MSLDTHSALNDAVTRINELVPDSRSGLPNELFYLTSRLTPLINVDLMIANEHGQTLLTWRADQFYGPGWHVPGGIIRFKEEAAQRIHKVAESELGVEVEADAYPVAFFEIMNPNRDIRGHFISLVYRCRLLSPLDPAQAAPALNAAQNGQWIWVDQMPPNMISQQKRFEHLFRL
jgi:colanic acid biosynthesis protein WcaH